MPTNDPNWLRTLDQATAPELDTMPFGIIQLDRAGRILRYNTVESELSGRDPLKVVGRSFFDEVAPCAAVRNFRGRFEEGMNLREFDETFDFMFDFEAGPVAVSIRLFFGRHTDTMWVVVRRRATDP